MSGTRANLLVMRAHGFAAAHLLRFSPQARRFGNWLQRIDIRKPTHMMAVALIIGAILAPVIGAVITNGRYGLSAKQLAVIAKPSPTLKSKLAYDAVANATIFNKDGADQAKLDAKDTLAAAAGGGGKKSNQLYTVTLPDDPSKGVAIDDNVNSIHVSFTPMFDTMDGRKGDGRVSYPLKDQAGQLLFTPKGNGVKEDILLDSKPKTNDMTYSYRIDLPDYLQARVDDDGTVGIYSGDPELFGNISYGSDKDRDAVNKARLASAKTYKMFTLPAPTIKQSGIGHKSLSAAFTLHDNILTVTAHGLQTAVYPISIDPTFVLTSTSDFVLGSIDDNIDLSVDDQVGRQALVGGSTPGWTPNSAPNLAYANFAAGLVAYNGYLYLMGGGSGAVGGAGTAGTTTNDVRYISLDPTSGALGTGTPATWTQTSLMITARQGLVAFGFNGYLYAVGGQDNSGVPLTAANSVEYALINSDGSVGAWHHTSNLNTVRAYPAGAIYQGVLYVMGGTSGTNNATPLSTVEYSRINGDGTVSAWTQSSSTATGNLTSARSKFRAGAYNGFLYITGGQTATTPNTAVLNTTQYAPIQSDGSVGPWVTTTPFLTARRDHGMAINNGYIYVFGGCSGTTQACTGFIADTQYAVINADGTIGQWQSTVPYNTGGFNSRMPGGVTQYSNHLYFVGGCSAETATNNCGTQLVGTFITNIDSVGRFDRGLSTATSPPLTGTSADPRSGGQAIALNGYLYYIGGCSVSGCASFDDQVEYASINADGSIGNFTTTTSLAAASGDETGRMGMVLQAYNNKVYAIGGVEKAIGSSPTTAAPTTSSTTTASATHNVAMPATVAAGDLLVIIITSGSSTATFTTPGGWTSMGTVTRGTNAPRMGIFVKSAAGTEGGTNVNVATSATTISSQQAYLVPAAGWWGDTSSSFANSVAVNTVDPGGTTNAPNPPAVTPGWGSSNDLWIAAAGGSTYAAPTTYPTGFTGGTSTIAGSGATGASTATAKLAATTASEDPAAFAMTTTTNGVAATIGIRPHIGTDTYTATIMTATQATNGTLGAWTAQSAGSGHDLPAARAFPTTELWHNNIYVLGGRDASTVYGTIYYASIDSSGNIGTWSTATTGIQARWGASGGAWGNWLYVVGGQSNTTGTFIGTTAANNAIQRINLNTATGNTSSATGYANNVSERFTASFVHNGFLYVFGGDQSAAVSANIAWAALDPTTGAPGTMVTTNIGNRGDLTAGITNARSQLGAVDAGGYFYLVGGCTVAITNTSFEACTSFISTANTTELYLPNNGGTGQANTWGSVTSLPTAVGDSATVAFNNHLYVLGGCTAYTAGVCSANTAAVKSNTITAGGDLGATWTTENSLPDNRYEGTAVAYNGYIYFMGGMQTAGSGGAGADLYYAPIGSTGTIGTWIDNVSFYMSKNLRGLSAAVSNGYIYVAGGYNSPGTLQNGVYYSQIQSDGSPGTWTTASTFTTARAYLNLVAYNGVLYVIGGYNNTTGLTDVQYAALSSVDGSVGTFAYTTDIGRGASSRQAVAANGFMYFIGNDGSTQQVQYAEINANGTLGPLQTSVATMTAAHPHASAAFYQGQMYVMGGCTASGFTCTAPITTSENAGQMAIARVGHYSKLFNTQVDTSPTQLVINGASAGPTSAVEFRFQTASSSDPVLGVAQLFRPVIFGQFYNVQALNSSGTNVGVAFNYLYIITLDDSRSGTFPDITNSGAGYSQTAVTDITLYYHANPLRRLRHGASFTNTACNPTDPTQGCILDTAP